MERHNVQGTFKKMHFPWLHDNLSRADVVLVRLLLRVMVAGPMDSGKSSLATILSAYAARYVEKSFRYVSMCMSARPILAIMS
jgi:hypothetical protein